MVSYQATPQALVRRLVTAFPGRLVAVKHPRHPNSHPPPWERRFQAAALMIFDVSVSASLFYLLSVPRKPKAALLLLLGIAIVACSLFLIRKREPAYHGRTLSEWTDAYSKSESPSEKAAAEAAVRQIGSNAFPFVLRWIDHNYQNNPKFLNKSPDFLKGAYERWIDNEQRRTTAGRRAQNTLIILGKDAAPLTPELLARLTPRNPQVQRKYFSSFSALFRIGTNGLPYFRPIIHDPGHPHYRQALRMVGLIADMDASAMSTAIEQLSSADANLVVWATWTLQLHRAPCHDVREPLQRNLTNTNELIRDTAADALRDLCPESAK